MKLCRVLQTLLDKMCNDFGIEFEQFDYAGMNGQTPRLQGTIHKDNYRRKNILHVV